MFKKLNDSWNARTPEYLHHGTKANIIWQLKLLAAYLAFMIGKDIYEERQARKRRTNTTSR